VKDAGMTDYRTGFSELYLTRGEADVIVRAEFLDFIEVGRLKLFRYELPLHSGQNFHQSMLGEDMRYVADDNIDFSRAVVLAVEIGRSDGISSDGSCEGRE
jgi:hypothetical protein